MPAFPVVSRHATRPFTSTAVHPESSDGEVTRQRGADARLLIRPVSFQSPRLQSGIEEPRSGRRILRRSAPPDRVLFTLSCNKQTRSALLAQFSPRQQREAVMLSHLWSVAWLRAAGASSMSAAMSVSTTLRATSDSLVLWVRA